MHARAPQKLEKIMMVLYFTKVEIEMQTGFIAANLTLITHMRERGRGWGETECVRERERERETHTHTHTHTHTLYV